MPPSLSWKERPAPDEAERYQRYADQFAQMQGRESQKSGKGRALHRKQLLAARASLEVLPDLPEPARHGLFAAPGRFDVWVRLSNGSSMRQSDSKPDIRGFALKVLGVSGPSALDIGPTSEQDFLLINHSAFAFAGSDEFIGLALAASRGGGALIGYLVKRYGVFGALRFIARFSKTLGKPFTGFASESFYSAAPIACGPYAARVRLAPIGRPAPAADKNWRGDFANRLAAGDLNYELQLQFFVDESTTPIEDASVDWPESVAPYVTVARLTIPRQDIATPGESFDAEAEASIFDPWLALADHRPLGDVMRARKAVYFRSEKERGAIPA